MRKSEEKAILGELAINKKVNQNKKYWLTISSSINGPFGLMANGRLTFGRLSQHQLSNLFEVILQGDVEIERVGSVGESNADESLSSGVVL